MDINDSPIFVRLEPSNLATACCAEMFGALQPTVLYPARHVTLHLASLTKAHWPAEKQVCLS